MKRYLIAGGSKGIGAALANLLSGESEVYVLSRKEMAARKNIQSFAVDVTDEHPAFPAIESLDGLVYCPGNILLKPFHSLQPDDYRKDMELNFIGAVKTISHYLPALKKTEYGSIVLFSTVAVQTGMPYHASVAAAKGAIEGFTRSLAAELAPRIRVNAIAPSLTDTSLAGSLLSTEEKRAASAKRHPLGRIGKPEEIAALAKFLMEEAQWITGQVIHIDGGMSSLKLL